MNSSSTEYIVCTMCPRACKLREGETGECQVRHCQDDSIRLSTYGYPVAIQVDPIEKKPLYHVLPGEKIFSIGMNGCNLHCAHCQNHALSQHTYQDHGIQAPNYSPKTIVDLALKNKLKAIALTYTEPLVSFEYTFDVVKAAKEAGLKTVLVSAGYFNQTPLKDLLPYVDAINFDLKSMDEKHYQEICKAKLGPVLKTLELSKKMNVFMEITNLVIPTLNDSPEQLLKLITWVKENLGHETPLHFSRFFPQYKLLNLPPTPEKTLTYAYKMAKDEGLVHVYLGNMPTELGQNTYCHHCQELLIERFVYHSEIKNLTSDGKCASCEEPLNAIL